jgi:hypothetical protein
MPIATDKALGLYQNSSGTFNVTVATPRITNFDVLTSRTGGSDVAGATLLTTDTDAAVLVEYNFARAENITLTVENADGLDVTNEWVENASSYNGTDISDLDVDAVGEVYFPLTTSDLDVGAYTLTVEGAVTSTSVRPQSRRR